MRRAIDDLVLRVVDLGVLLRHPRLSRRVHRLLGRLPRAAHPQEYSERMLFRKALDRNPRFVTFSDKLAAKAYCAARCPDLALPATLWQGTDIREAPAAVLAGDVYVKASHGFGWNLRLPPGPPDLDDLHDTTQGWLRQRHGRREGEWAYRHVAPRLLVEETIGDPAGDLIELEIRAGSGRVILGSIVGHQKLPGEWRVFLGHDGEPLSPPPPEVAIHLTPQVLAACRRAAGFAEQLAVGVDYARFDFFVTADGRLYGGEITVFPAAGAEEIADPVRRRMTLDGWVIASSHLVSGRPPGWRRIYAAALGRRLAASQPVRGA